ncbi:MAG: MarR family transcriptional regulator [Bryobacteraceae bacterium]|nr:MarR family transcriptional regulator [Bryobacteraceae bacterium]
MKLVEEIRQKKPFATPAQEAVVALMRTTDGVRRRIAEVVEPKGISYQQYNVLRILRGAGDAGLATLEVVERMVERTPAITRLMDKLEAKKLIRRKRCKEDRRRVLCYIERKGLDLLAGLDEAVAKAGEAALEGLKAKQTEKLIRLLEIVREG